MQVRELYQSPITEGSMFVYEQTLNEAGPLLPAVMWILRWVGTRALWPLLKWLLKKLLKTIGLVTITGWLGWQGLKLAWDSLKELVGPEAIQLMMDHGIELALAGVLVYGAVKLKKYIEKHGENLADRWTNAKTEEEFEESLSERQVWAKSGKKVVRKYRCTTGQRKGRTVAKMAQCYAAPDIKKRMQLKRTKARLGKRLARKARRTKRINPASMRVARLNRRR